MYIYKYIKPFFSRFIYSFHSVSTTVETIVLHFLPWAYHFPFSRLAARQGISFLNRSFAHAQRKRDSGARGFQHGGGQGGKREQTYPKKRCSQGR